MKPTNLIIKDLFTADEKLTFLVGAGCSADPPSCLPTGRPMMKAIINYTCAESEIKKILELKDLRFEQLVEILRDTLDPELKIIDYYAQCNRPNLQHFFLADMIKKGHFVMTTNFDFLIEYALLQSGISKEEVVPVITKTDFQKFNDPSKLFKKGKKALYKIHGSSGNIITGENTKDSLIATIQAFGSNKEGLNTFQVEPFKRSLFNNITRNRSLVLLGYSGHDDFDIIPSLKVLKNIQNFIWVNHSKKVEVGSEIIYEMNPNYNTSLNNLYNNRRRVNQILLEIKRMDCANNVYRLDVDTTSMVGDLIEIKPKLSSNKFSLKFKNYYKKKIKNPNELFKSFIPHKIYLDFDMYDDALRIVKDMLCLIKKSKDHLWKALILNNIGIIYQNQGNYSRALEYYGKALKLDEQFHVLQQKGHTLNNIGLIYQELGNYTKALEYYEKNLQISEQPEFLSSKSISLNNIGEILRYQGKFIEARKKFKMALGISEHLGDLSGKATILNNIGLLYIACGDYSNALNKYEETLEISEHLGDLRRKIATLNNIGMIFREQKNYHMALTRFKEALHIANQRGVLVGKQYIVNNIGSIYEAQKKYQKALEQYQKALKIAEQLGDDWGKSATLSNIASIRYRQGNYPKALKLYEEALEILNILGLSESPNAKNFKQNIEIVKSEMK